MADMVFSNASRIFFEGSLKLGTGVAETIRVYADEYRDKRLQAAEENAAKLGVKMIFPMMWISLPTVPKISSL